MAGPTDVVIAGTKPFALALFAPVTERAGSRPRIAPEPATALTLCAESSGVLVVEYEPRWLPALTQLRQQRPGLRVVAALPRGQEAAAISLGTLSIDAVPWDGKAISVLPAIERAIGGPGAGAPPPPPVTAAPTAPTPPVPASSQAAPAAPPTPGQVPPPEAAPSLDLLAGLGARPATPTPGTQPAGGGDGHAPAHDLFAGMDDPAAAPALASQGPAPAAPTRIGSGAPVWPADGPSAIEAEQVLRAALAGQAGDSPLRAVSEQVAAGLSALEREVFAGGPLALDVEPIRHAAVLRLRVAAAFATRPPPGTASDAAAVAELLSEIDGVLDAVKAMLADAPPLQKVSLEAIRNALVKEAVDFSEACHEVGTAELPLAPAPVRNTGRAAAARVLSVRAGVDQADRPEERRRRVMPVVILVLVLAAGGAYHAWNQYTAPPRQPPATYEGAPAGTMAVQNGKSFLLVALPGQAVNKAELETYRQREARRGNTVREVIPGTWIIEPAQAGGGATP